MTYTSKRGRRQEDWLFLNSCSWYLLSRPPGCSIKWNHAWRETLSNATPPVPLAAQQTDADSALLPFWPSVGAAAGGGELTDCTSQRTLPSCIKLHPSYIKHIPPLHRRPSHESELQATVTYFKNEFLSKGRICFTFLGSFRHSTDRTVVVVVLLSCWFVFLYAAI